MKIALFSNDLMFQSRISATAKSQGSELVVARSWEMLRSKLSAEDSLDLAIFDLSFRSLELNETVRLVKQDYPKSSTLAYGPHVDTESLRSAAQIGIDHVLTRGQFERDMEQWLGEREG
jgi:DNA-binding NarL/FixJ family response regulator